MPVEAIDLPAVRKRQSRGEADGRLIHDHYDTPFLDFYGACLGRTGFSIIRAPCRKVMAVPGQRSQAAR
jgi:hypothetical protein